jgi:hypothetical protein
VTPDYPAEKKFSGEVNRVEIDVDKAPRISITSSRRSSACKSPWRFSSRIHDRQPESGCRSTKPAPPLAYVALKSSAKKDAPDFAAHLLAMPRERAVRNEPVASRTKLVMRDVER